MSLKIFHFIFIVAAILTALGFAVWAFFAYRDNGQGLHLIYAVGSGIVGIGLIFYFKYVLRKLKDMPYL